MPFHVNRFFRPSLLDEFSYTNYMIGIAFTTYGMSALLSYFPGGYIADKFDARKLLSISLILTSFGGLMLFFYPNFYFLCFIYGYWGITSILFCWSALIKATRIVGGNRQGLSFGILEAGRGLVAAILSSIAVFLYSNNLLQQILDKYIIIKTSPLSIVILFYTITTFTAGILIWLFYKSDKIEEENMDLKFSINKLKNFYKILIWQSLIVLSSYSAYKGIDYYSQYFYEILNYSKEKAALTMSNFSYLRPICAISAGIIADKITASRLSIYIFIIMVLSFFLLAIISTNINLSTIIIINILISMLAIFAMRGIYFCYLKEKEIPSKNTGVSVGIISLIGFFPDVYIGPIFGYILDNFNSFTAFKLCYLFLLIISIIGLISSYNLYKTKRKS